MTHATSDAIRAALAHLGIDRLVLAVHPASFPRGEADIGVGSPYGEAGRAFVAWAAELGFNGLALGPCGITSRDNPSPYDGTWLSRDPMLLDFAALPVDVTPAVAAGGDRDDRTDHAGAWGRARALLRQARRRLRAADSAGLDAQIESLRARAPWLDAEAAFEGRAAVEGDDWRRWQGAATDPEAVDDFRVGQLWLEQQQRAFRDAARGEGVCVYADLHIGPSLRDRLLHKAAFLDGYALGAPPSRTNPAGQAWGYPVMAPTAAARALLSLRLRTLLSTHDGLRLDHPHGWVCPWVYVDGGDASENVRAGARLHESPDDDDHPTLAAHAFVRAEQLDKTLPRHHDHRVVWLDDAQVDRFAVLVDLVVAEAAAAGVAHRDLMAEVLSTCPRPLQAVLARHQLGRFRVTQKANIHDPSDVYRSDNAVAADWIMFGNHDTKPLRAVVDSFSDEVRAARAAWLTALLVSSSSPAEQQAFCAQLQADPTAMAEAFLAELFCSQARHVSVFWVDLFGIAEVYNRPGVVDVDNWTLRVPASFRAVYARAVRERRAPDLGRALALALRRAPEDAAAQALAHKLDPR